MEQGHVLLAEPKYRHPMTCALCPRTPEYVCGVQLFPHSAQTCCLVVVVTRSCFNDIKLVHRNMATNMPQQDIDDVVAKLRDMKLSVKKASKVAFWDTLPQQVIDAGAQVKGTLASLLEDFAAIDDKIFCQAVVDLSVVNRPSEVASYSGAQSNKLCAYLGDALLTQRIAIHAFKTGMPPVDYSKLRQTKTSREHLARMYDTIFKDGNVVVSFPQDGVNWREPPTTNQKAEFIEALIGVVFVTGNTSPALWLVKQCVGVE